MKHYQLGDRRLIKRFAWLPIRLTANSKLIWLRGYYTIQEWKKVGRPVRGYTVVNREWADIYVAPDMAGIRMYLSYGRALKKAQKKEWLDLVEKHRSKK